MGLTTNDVWDTATALQLRAAADLLIAGQERLRASLRTLALRYRDTLTIGRTHGVHAEPTTFGLKLAVWYAELGAQPRAAARAREAIAVGKLSGAVGNFAHLAPEVEEAVCARLASAASRSPRRSCSATATPSSARRSRSLAATLRRSRWRSAHLQRTEVREAEEPFAAGQKGSRAMPHKRNPIGRAHLRPGPRGARQRAGRARGRRPLARARHQPLVGRAGDRARRHDLARLHARRCPRAGRGARRRPARMAENLEASHGNIYSQRVLLKLTRSGVARQVAYGWCSDTPCGRGRSGGRCSSSLAADPSRDRAAGPGRAQGVFDPAWFVRNVDPIFRRAGLVGS